MNVAVAVVTFQAGPLVEAYIKETSLPWPILIDSSRTLYHGYGMERGRAWDLFGPAAWLIYFKLLLRGRRLKTAHGDVHQLGGDVLIDPQGVVRLHHVGRGPADRPPIARILDAARQGGQTKARSASE